MPATLITNSQRLIGASTQDGYSIRIYDDGYGPLFISRNSIGIYGIVRARTWEDAYSICEDEFFDEAQETIEELIQEYGFKREHIKIIHPLLEDGSINTTVEKDATLYDYNLSGGRLLDGQFIRWETRETPAPDAWTENELFQEAFGFRPNGRNHTDKIGHGIYSKDLNGDTLDLLTPQLLAHLGITLQIEDEESN